MDDPGIALDDAVVDAYRNQANTVDEILTDPSVAIKFADTVKAKLPCDGAPEDRVILRRLITLRKRGEDRGGLPRTTMVRPRKPR